MSRRRVSGPISRRHHDIAGHPSHRRHAAAAGNLQQRTTAILCNLAKSVLNCSSDLKMKGNIVRSVSLLFAIVFVVSVHGAEVLTAAQAQPERSSCECASDCVCRSPSKDCNCSGPELTMKARCGCGGPDSHHEGTAPSWDTVFAKTCCLGAPPLIVSPAPILGDPEALRIPFEHEHPPKPLP